MLLVAKPAGPTSHDVVDMVRRALETTRVGHLGTLDPFAAGLLVLVVGRATRLAQFANGWRKTYDGTIRLGVTTTTDDGTGEPQTVSDAWRSLDRAMVEQALCRFRGTVTQRPPAHSAVNVAGERAYRRARRGEAVVIPERQVSVEALELLEFTPPEVRFRATVGGGTYIRSLARDLGAALGCGGHLVALVRTAVGPFRLTEAKAPAAVTRADLIDAAALVADLPQRALEPGERDAAVHGRPVSAMPGTRETGNVAMFADGRLVAVAECVGDVLKPRVVVAE